MNMDNLKLGTKALLPVALLAGLFATGTWVSMANTTKTTVGYEALTEHSYQGVVKALRANLLALQIGEAVHIVLDYDTDRAVVQKALKDFAAAKANVDAVPNDAAKVDPQHAQAYAGFRDRIGAIREEAKVPRGIAKNTPGADHGSTIKPAELDDMAKVANLRYPPDEKLEAVVQDIVAFNNGLLDEIKAKSEGLHAGAEATIRQSLVVSVVAILAGIGFSIWISRSKVVGPLLRLSAQMSALANRDLSQQVEGAGRGDEIGGMAKALQTFKDNALALKAAEAPAASHHLRREAGGLAEMIGKFRVSSGGHNGRGRASAPRPALKTTAASGGGALRKAEVDSDADSWKEF